MPPTVLRVIAILVVLEFPRGSFQTEDIKFCASSESTITTKNSRRKRNVLAFPPDSLLQINMGITLAQDLEKNSASIALAFQQNAVLPNESQPLLLPSLVVTGRRFSIYDHLTSVLTNYGFEGLECLRKMVCQISRTPLLNGLLEDVITFVLSPSRHRRAEKPESSQTIEMFLEAEKLGSNGGNCTLAFPRCVRTPLDIISTLIHV